jgi:uncharacterized protein (TIGR00251 family)
MVLMPGEQELPCITLQRNGLVCIWIYVQPRASKSGFVGIHDGCLKLAITSPPVDNKANRAVISYLAEFFHIARNCIRLNSGEKSRRKLLCIKGVGVAEIQGRLEGVLQRVCEARSDQ